MRSAVFKCFQIINSFHSGNPPSSLQWHSISALIYAVSIPIRPGIETAWAGMENPTSVQTETHSSLALQFGQSAAILTEAFQENLTSSLPPFLCLHLLCHFNTSQPSRVYIWNWVWRGTAACVWYSSWTLSWRGTGRNIMTNRAQKLDSLTPLLSCRMLPISLDSLRIKKKRSPQN